MSGKRRSARTDRVDPWAVFAALGDPTRLALIDRLGKGGALSLSRLSESSDMTRQAVTKHLRVLEKAGVVDCQRVGRESLYTLEPEPFDAMRRYLDAVARQWDDALLRLKSLVED